MFKDLNDFIAALDKERELARIAEPVSPDLEICAVTDRASKSPGGGPASCSSGRPASTCRSPINLFGSMKRMCMALGVRTLDDLAHEIEELTTPKMPGGMMDALKMLPMVNRLRDLMPKTVSDAPCQEVVEKDGSLDELPILKCWPEDGGRYITLPLVFTKDPETGVRNIGTYRMQVFDGRSTGMHWQRHKGGAQHYRVAERLGKRLPVAVALGPGSRAGVFGDGADARRARRADARRAFCGASASSSSSASRSISRCRRTRRSCSKATSSPASAAARGRSAITPASTRIPTTIRSST